MTLKRLPALAAFKLSAFLRGKVSEDLFKTYSRLIAPDVTRADVDAISEEPEKLFADLPSVAARWQRIYDQCEGDAIALTAMELYLLAVMDERTLDLLRDGMGLTGGVTIEAAGRLTYPEKETIEIIPLLRRAFERVEILLQAEPSRDMLKAGFRLDGRLAAWLSGDDSPDHLLKCEAAMLDDELPVPVLTGAEIEDTAQMLAGYDGFSVTHISGQQGSGRRFFARHTARKLGEELLLVSFDAVAENGVLCLGPWRRLLREMMLSDRLLCLCDVGGDRGRIPSLLRQMEKDLAPLDRPVFITTDSTVKVVPFFGCRVHAVSIPDPTIPQSIALWRSLSEQYLTGENFPAEGLAAKMTLTAGQMEKIVKMLRFRNADGPWGEREIFKLCYKVLDDGRYENIRFVDTEYTWEDLQLEEPLRESLRAVCAQVENQGLVLDEWGLRRRYPYGRCVSVLMSGPPGTGKTMTAQVLASQLGLELYKVDLSQIVDKYIGETEKRLKQVFEQAEKSNMVLFFDEADALLGKRSEVKEAKDKYANTEVAYLLQKMEEYSGIVLMATNQAGNMDSAFLRRFRYHLVFTLPDEAMRRKLWSDALAGIPSKQIQLDYLARQFQISGAQIKNIALNAAYRAAEDEGVLRMEHLVRAVFQEFQKEGKVLLSSEFGEYGVMLSDYLGQV